MTVSEQCRIAASKGNQVPDPFRTPSELLLCMNINVPWKAMELAKIHRFQLPVAS